MRLYFAHCIQTFSGQVQCVDSGVFDLDGHDTDWLQTTGLLTPHQEGKIAHVWPHDIIIEKTETDKAAPATLKDWQHLGGLIRLELVKTGSNGSAAPVFAEMPNDQRDLQNPLKRAELVARTAKKRK